MARKKRSGKNRRGNANALRRYWAYGRGAGKVAWNTPGDFTRCVAQVSRYMSKRQAKGFCANSHKRATGGWPGQHGGRTKRGKATR